MKYLYRMTHIDNIPHILKYGITHRLSPNANPDYIPIGDSSIIDKRKEQTVKTIVGEEFSPGDFIPFYYYVRMPMLYNIQHGYNVTKVKAEDIVYLVVLLDAIIRNPDFQFYFSDGHAISKMTRFYGKESILNIDNILDKNAIISNDWGNDYVVRERKQAEFLVGNDIPADCICMLGCYNETVRNKLLSMGAKCDIRMGYNAYY